MGQFRITSATLPFVLSASRSVYKGVLIVVAPLSVLIVHDNVGHCSFLLITYSFIKVKCFRCISDKTKIMLFNIFENWYDK